MLQQDAQQPASLRSLLWRHRAIIGVRCHSHDTSVMFKPTAEKAGELPPLQCCPLAVAPSLVTMVPWRSCRTCTACTWSETKSDLCFMISSPYGTFPVSPPTQHPLSSAGLVSILPPNLSWAPPEVQTRKVTHVCTHS